MIPEFIQSYVECLRAQASSVAQMRKAGIISAVVETEYFSQVYKILVDIRNDRTKEEPSAPVNHQTEPAQAEPTDLERPCTTADYNPDQDR